MTNADILDALRRDVAAAAAKCTCTGSTKGCELYGGGPAEARARIDSLPGPALLEALIGRLPVNGRGECFMCSLGNEPDEEMRHYDHINNEAESYCLQSEIYDDARIAIADAGKALGL